MWINYPGGTFTIYNDHNTGVYESWNELNEELKENRYIINPNKSIFRIIDRITDIVIDSQNVLYRARINEGINSYGNGTFEKSDLGAPPPEKCRPSRLNPVGVSYLYLADTKETCISELRPWIGSKVEVATFFPNRKLFIKDLTKNENDDEEMELLKQVLKINFSKPVSGSRTEFDYMITQCITEYIKNYCKTSDGQDYDGIKYYSSVNNNGYNIVIFEANKMNIGKIIGRAEITNIKVEF